MDPFDVMDAGSMAGFIDPAGAFVCAWQPGNHKGAEIVNEPGGFCWNELQSRDINAAKTFYNKVFNWEAADMEMGGTAYTLFKVGGKDIAGGMAMGPDMPAEVPSNWVTYFSVADVDASVKKVQELGGSIMVPTMDSPVGRFAIAADQVGAAFAIIQLPG
jgi:predicted enzyme related to lactoylglutathione lyase